jgi:hypothetical protein
MKAWKVALIVGGVAVLAVGAGVAFAQSDDPPPGNGEYSRKFWNSQDRPWGIRPRAQFDALPAGPLGEGLLCEGESLELHDLILTTLADQLGLTVEELESRMETEGGLMAVLLAQDLSFTDARELLLEIQTEVVQEAIEQGLIDEVQTECMLDRLQQFGSRERGLGSRGFRLPGSSGERPDCQVDS